MTETNGDLTGVKQYMKITQHNKTAMTETNGDLTGEKQVTGEKQKMKITKNNTIKKRKKRKPAKKDVTNETKSIKTGREAFGTKKMKCISSFEKETIKKST